MSLIIDVVLPRISADGTTRLCERLDQLLANRLDSGQIARVREFGDSLPCQEARLSRLLARLALLGRLPSGTRLISDENALPALTPTGFLSFSHPPGRAFAILDADAPVAIDAEYLDPSVAGSISAALKKYGGKSVSIQAAVTIWTIFETAIKLMPRALPGAIAEELFPHIVSASQSGRAAFRDGRIISWQSRRRDNFIITFAGIDRAVEIPRLIKSDWRDIVSGENERLSNRFGEAPERRANRGPDSVTTRDASFQYCDIVSGIF
ncbi:MAG: hypothetical protein K2H64_04165 [Desulfovibrio sp.]|nr:hypothetical protein [Desulfovibrio sp.]